MGLEWGDMYRRTDALVLTRSEDVVYQPSVPVPLPHPSRNIREDLFETDEDFFQDMTGKDLQTGSLYPTYVPSRQIASSFSLNLPAIDENDDDEIYFPSYDDVQRSDKVELMEPPAETAPVAKRPVSPDPVERPEDDTAIRVQPSRHVDYLSHDWAEEDVWASWKHIVSKRGAYNNSARLENASWRSWAKKRSNLKTVPPETVKWMKDHDLTWLYGPLTPGSCAFGESCSSNSRGHRLSRAAIIARHNKKPILKKRSLSEIMLQRSISSSLLLKQAVGAKLRKDTPPTSFPFESPALTRSNTGMLSSKSTSGLETPEGWKKVQFHELVEQCIALANAGDEEHEYHYCSDSDDDVIVMRKAKKRATSKWLPAIKPKKQAGVSKTIEKLPHAPLKYPEEFDDVPEESSETFRSSDSASPSSEEDASDPIVLDLDSDEEDDMYWQPPAWLQDRKDSVQIVKDRLSDIKMQEGAAVEAISAQRPHLERRDAVKDEQNVPHVSTAPTRVNSDSTIKFELPPCRSQLASFSFDSASKFHRPRGDYFMIDPGMTEGESEASVDTSRSSSQSSESSSDSNSPGLGLDHFQQTLVERVMGEFWVLFNQQWDTYIPRSVVSSPVSPSGPATPLLVSKRRRVGDKRTLSRTWQQRKGYDKSNYFETIPEEAPPSPDSKELVEYESYIHRELPRLVHRSIDDAVRRDSQPKEAHLIGNLVSIIHDCQEKVYQSYVEMTDRDDNNDSIKGLGIMSTNPFQTSNVSIDSSSEHHHSELLDAAFQPPPSQYISSYRSSLQSSTVSSASECPSIAPTTPGEMVFSDSGHASEIASTMTSPNPSRRGTDANKYSLPRDVRGKDARPVRELDLYDELDEAISWSRAY